jgi:hypothetical protein
MDKISALNAPRTTTHTLYTPTHQRCELIFIALCSNKHIALRTAKAAYGRQSMVISHNALYQS